MSVSTSGHHRSRPVMMIASRSEERRAAVAAQLEERYAATYEVVSVATSSDAADALDAAAADGRQVAILLADDPGGLDDGRTVFQVAARLFPDVRRGLLVEWGAWGDRDTADLVLTLMAQGQIDYYVIRPWHSPDEYFHRTVTEFLSEWDRAVGLRPREVSVIGDPASARSHEVRRLLALNGIPHAFVPSGAPEAGGLLAGTGRRAGCRHRGPVSTTDGPGRPDERGARGRLRVGGRRAQQRGVRPRGHRRRAGRLAAAVYASSEGLRTLVVERESIGGQAGSSSLIRNYLGFARGISGPSWPNGPTSRPGCSAARSRTPGRRCRWSDDGGSSWASSPVAPSTPRPSCSPPACRTAGSASPSWSPSSRRASTTAPRPSRRSASRTVGVRRGRWQLGRAGRPPPGAYAGRSRSWSGGRLGREHVAVPHRHLRRRVSRCARRRRSGGRHRGPRLRSVRDLATGGITTTHRRPLRAHRRDPPDGLAP